MKTFKQFITEEDDAFDALGEVMNFYNKPLYKVYESEGECKVVTVSDFINDMQEYEQNEDYGGRDSVSVVGKDDNELYNIGTSISEILPFLIKDYIVIVKMYDISDQLYYCSDKKRLQEFLPLYIMSKFVDNTRVTDEQIERYTKYIINKLDALP